MFLFHWKKIEIFLTVTRIYVFNKIISNQLLEPVVFVLVASRNLSRNQTEILRNKILVPTISFLKQDESKRH